MNNFAIEKYLIVDTFKMDQKIYAILRWSVPLRGSPYQTDQRHQVFYLTVCYQTCKHNILYTDKLILLQIGTSGPRGKEMKRSTFEVKRSKVKVTRMPKFDLKTWRRNCSQSSRFLVYARHVLHFELFIF